MRIYKHFYEVTVELYQIEQGSCNTNIDIECPFRRLDVSQADAYSFLSKIENKLGRDENIISVKYSKKNPDLWIDDDYVSGECGLVILSKSSEEPYYSFSGDKIFFEPNGAVVSVNLYAKYRKTTTIYKSVEAGVTASMRRKFTKYPSSYVKANSDTCESAHWEAIAEFSDGTTLEFTRPVTVSGWRAEDDQQHDIECELLDKATNTGKEVVFYTVNFVCDD